MLFDTNVKIRAAYIGRDFDAFIAAAKSHSVMFMTRTLIYMLLGSLAGVHATDLSFRASIVVVLAAMSLAVVMCAVVGSLIYNLEYYYEGDFLYDPVVQQRIKNIYMRTTVGSGVLLIIGQAFAGFSVFFWFMSKDILVGGVPQNLQVGAVFLTYIMAIIVHTIASTTPRA